MLTVLPPVAPTWQFGIEEVSGPALLVSYERTSDSYARSHLSMDQVSDLVSFADESDKEDCDAAAA